MAETPQPSAIFAISTALTDESSKPLRIFTVTGFLRVRTMAERISSTSFGFLINAEPSPFLTIFGTGQPMLMSKIS